MATASRLRPGSQAPDIDIRLIISEAQTRWLRPLEVCEILQNYAKYGFKLNPVPPIRPISGSMFLFDRKTLRYFRKDGHNWRKKKDGRTVREAHERLKIGSVDVLHCYYAHGEDNPSFQRRCYWLLDTALEHIVLVHYREVTEGGRFSMSDSAHNAHAASPSEVSHPAASPESYQEDGDLVESEDVEEVKGDVQDTLLDQITPRAQSDTNMLNSSRTNSWPGSEPRAEFPTSNSWFNSSSGAGGNSALKGFESFLDSPTGLTPKPGENSHQLLNRQQFEPTGFTSNTEQTYAQPMPQEFFPLSTDQYAGNNSGSGSYSEGLDKSNTYSSDAMGNGQRQANLAAAIDLAGWRQVLESTPKSNPVYSQGSSGSQSGARTGSSLPPLNAFVKKESLSSSPWADMLEQVTTPATHRNLLDTLMSSNQPHVSESQETQSQQVPLAKGILEAFSPRGLGREPQTPLEASLRAVTEEKAIKTAVDLYQRRQSSSRSDSLPLDFLFENKAAQEKGGLKIDDPLRKMDSFGRWMSQFVDSPNSLGGAAFQSNWANTPTVGDQGMGDDLFSIPRQMPVDAGMGLSDMRFSITDFSPESAFASEGAKVLITGEFLGGFENAHNSKWCCMFGDVEVPAELVSSGVLRCKAPQNPVGRVPLYVTCGDRQCHSEMRTFEYRAGGRGPLDMQAERQATEERLLKIRLSRLLLSEPGEAVIDLTSNLDSTPLFHNDGEWVELENLARTSEHSSESSFQERLFQMLLKVRMQKWLPSKILEEGKGASVLDEEGQGVLHMAAALGYDWVVAPMLAAGVPINFRDGRGWTALHWAAYYGKEQMVIALLGQGADPGTVTDPTPSCPSGQTPADLASLKGHAGIGGFLAESSLTRRLSSMTLVENPDDMAMSHIAAETAVAKLSRRESVKRSISAAADQDQIHESLQAVRNAARAAALIQAAFRQHSFRKREEDDMASSNFDEYGMTQTQMQALLAVQKIQKAYRGHQEKKQQLAASRIQQKFRSWKVRRDFLKFRQRVVRIQAQVRGNLVRKRFRKLLWSVGVLEKVVLRWKRKRLGLRGFKSGELSVDGKEDDEEFLKEGRKQAIVALEKSVTTVQTMVRSPQARAQYRRLREGSLRADQLGQCLSEVSSPQGLLTSADAEFQYYEESQLQQIYMDPTADDQLMNFTD